MASEATVMSSLQITKRNLAGTLTILDYRSNPTMFRADVAGTNGPTPGAVTVAVAGTDIDFSQLTAFGGLCRVANLDGTNYVEYGIYDTSTDEFYPLAEILPGETYPLRLSRHLQEEYVGTGTGGPACTMRFRANTAPCVVLVEAFDP